MCVCGDGGGWRTQEDKDGFNIDDTLAVCAMRPSGYTQWPHRIALSNKLENKKRMQFVVGQTKIFYEDIFF